MRKINEEEFDELIYDDEKKTVIFFHRKGCYVCEELSTLLEEMEEDYGTELSFAEVDVEEEADLFARFSLKGVPQTILFANGNLLETLSGRKEDEVYEVAFENLIGA